MSGIPLTALLPELGGSSRESTRRWVSAALAHADALSAYDRWLYPRDPGRQAAAERLHEAWQAWVDDAEAVLRQAIDQDIPGIESLRDQVCIRQGMLKMPPALIAQRREQVARGEVHSMEEVRRELRAGSRG